MSLSNLDLNFPRFTEETTEEKVSQIQDYLYILLENLRYTLSNLGAENFNPVSLSKITEPVSAKIKDLEGNVTELNITAQGLSTRVSSAEGNISSLEQTASGLTSRVQSAEGDISSLQQTATGLTSRVSSAEGNITTLTQTATGLTSRVTDAEGHINTITQTLSGVAFESDLAAGRTVINGGCITTGTLAAEKIMAGTMSLGNSSVPGRMNFFYGSGGYTYMAYNRDGVVDLLEIGSADANITIDTMYDVSLSAGGGLKLYGAHGIILENCYGDDPPDSSTPGYGTEGAVYFEY